MNAYLLLTFAIFSEVIATTSLKASNGFTRPLPSVLVVIGYGFSFYLLALVMRALPVGVVYAIWCGVGILLVMVTSFFVFKEMPDLPAIIGCLMIVGGVLVIQLFSHTKAH
ncbi:multidrug efflux SMR transporter [Leeia sp. TBRC 13508]|uniref:Multidrug efflux SMR transporter n=1 Tax=Leeia speluncae TaxID=2884804 RepID=A0ABS8DA59_9NEIS|nr:multidrug efflux SMR transporter [Leeia speluncae]MCB6184811.1 multidrug efflux SMR transporter [Leeia speluncae]